MRLIVLSDLVKCIGILVQNQDKQRQRTCLVERLDPPTTSLESLPPKARTSGSSTRQKSNTPISLPPNGLAIHESLGPHARMPFFVLCLVWNMQEKNILLLSHLCLYASFTILLLCFCWTDSKNTQIHQRINT